MKRREENSGLIDLDALLKEAMPMRLRNKVAIVTDGGTGIKEAIARVFTYKGSDQDPRSLVRFRSWTEPGSFL